MKVFAGLQCRSQEAQNAGYFCGRFKILSDKRGGLWYYGRYYEQKLPL